MRIWKLMKPSKVPVDLKHSLRMLVQHLGLSIFLTEKIMRKATSEETFGG